MEALLNHGAAVDKATTDDGVTPLILASAYSHHLIVEALLQHGATVDKARTTDGLTPLYVASQNGNHLVVETLLNHGADPNKARTTTGSTPLYIASQDGNLPVVQALLKKGADPNKANLDGVTPIQAATTPGLADFMREYDRRNKTMLGIAALDNVTRDTDATLPLDLYEYLGKKVPNGNYVAGRRRKTRKSRKTKKSKKSKKRRRL